MSRSASGLARAGGVLFALGLLAAPGSAGAHEAALPAIRIGFEGAGGSGGASLALQILLAVTVLTLAPAILVLLTSFTRIVVVLSFLRNALGTPSMPPNQIVVGLSLVLTFFVMSPTWEAVYSQAVRPYLEGEATQAEAVELARPAVQRFLTAHAREKDVALFVRLSKAPPPQAPEDVPFSALVPAFVISELRTAFTIGFLLYLPFVVIDLVVAGVLMSLGMFMMPPLMVSLPFKVAFFVLVDGWNLVVGNLVRGFLG